MEMYSATYVVLPSTGHHDLEAAPSVGNVREVESGSTKR